MADAPPLAPRSRCSSTPRADGKAAGAKAGLGWQGKHTNLVSRESAHGSSSARSSPRPISSPTSGERPLRLLPRLPRYLPDQPPSPPPTNSMPDAAFPISPSSTKTISREFRTAIGNRIYGCDDCLAVCPWNNRAQAAREAKLAARDALTAPRLAELRSSTRRHFVHCSPPRRSSASAATVLCATC